MADKPKTPEPKKLPEDYARYSGIAFQMIAIVLLGFFGGMMLDKYIPMKFPLFMVGLSILAVFLSIYVVVREFLKK